jgi:hypothetical protein
VLARQLVQIESELKKEHARLYSLEDKKPDYMKLLHLASDYLKNPSKIWENAGFERKLALQRFQFPEGILFDGQKIGTRKIVSIYNVNREIWNEKSRKGYFEFKKLKLFEKNSFIDENEKIVYWNTISNYLQTLGDILKDGY